MEKIDRGSAPAICYRWSAVKAMARDTGISVARAEGEIIEQQQKAAMGIDGTIQFGTPASEAITKQEVGKTSGPIRRIPC